MSGYNHYSLIDNPQASYKKLCLVITLWQQQQ